MSQELITTSITEVLPVSQDDLAYINMWSSSSESLQTQRSYKRIALDFLNFAGVGIRQITAAHIIAYRDSLTTSSDGTRNTTIGVIKSLFQYGMTTGALSVNPAAVVKTPSVKNTLNERILEETDVIRMIALEMNKRNHALLRLMYATGLRVSEVAGLTWKDVTRRNQGAQLTVYGKGGDTRFVLIPTPILEELQNLGEQVGPIFKSRKGNEGLTDRQITRIVKEAAIRAGLTDEVSAHWLRHANASHSLENGASIAVVQASLGHKSLTTTSKYTHARPTDGTANYIKI